VRLASRVLFFIGVRLFLVSRVPGHGGSAGWAWLDGIVSWLPGIALKVLPSGTCPRYFPSGQVQVLQAGLLLLMLAVRQGLSPGQARRQDAWGLAFNPWKLDLRLVVRGWGATASTRC
jgi:hypothetical protein